MSVQKKAAGSKYKKIEKDNVGLHRIIALLLIIGLVPLIVGSKIVYLGDFEKLSLGDGPKLDIFSYYKTIFFLLFSAAGLVIFLIKRDRSLLEDNKKPIYILAGIYTAFVILSAITSEYKQIAFWGLYERYEGAFVLIAYIFVFLLAMNIATDDKAIRFIIMCLIGSSFIISLIGILQYFDINLVKYIAMATVPENAKVTLSSKSGFKTLSSTLYNSNFVGSYMAMLLPVVLLSFGWVKKQTNKIALAILFCLIVLNWILCDSRAGIVGGITAFFVLIVMYRKKIFKYRLFVAAIIVLLCGGLVAINFATHGSVVERIKRITSIAGKDLTAENSTSFQSVLKGLNDVSMNKDRAKIVTEKGTLQIVLLDGGELKIVDENDKDLDFSLDNDIINLSDERFSNIKLENKSQDGTMYVYYNNYKLIDIIFTDTGLMSTSNRWMPYRDDKNIEKFGFEGMETFGSNRGYIWSRTLPLLKNTILIGHGPDTFPMYFPQYDFVGKLSNYLTGDVYVDKPHDFYLQTAMNTGVVSLLALLALFGIYFVASIKIYIKDEFSTFKSIAGLACFAAFCGYAVSAIFNDSIISVAPVFWILFGMGAGINISLIKDKRKSITVKQTGKGPAVTGKKNR